MFKTSLYASIIVIGLALTGPTQVACAGGLFHHHTWSQSSAFAAPVMTTQAFAAPMMTTQAFAAPMMTTQAFAAPMMTTQAFAAPLMTTQAFTSAAPSVSQAAMQYALVPMAVSGQSQAAAQAQGAVPQFGVSDITSILDLLGRLRGALSPRGNGGTNLNPVGGGTGLDGNRPIEVRVTITADGSGTAPATGSGSHPLMNQDLLDFLKKNGVQFAAPAAVPSAVQPSGQAASTDPKFDDILKRLQGLTADVEALKKAGK
jgi:hypothetical protein